MSKAAEASTQQLEAKLAASNKHILELEAKLVASEKATRERDDLLMTYLEDTLASKFAQSSQQAQDLETKLDQKLNEVSSESKENTKELMLYIEEKLEELPVPEAAAEVKSGLHSNPNYPNDPGQPGENVKKDNPNDLPLSVKTDQDQQNDQVAGSEKVSSQRSFPNSPSREITDGASHFRQEEQLSPYSTHVTRDGVTKVKGDE